jgi:pyruvate/2-oxoglutarate dehydrogenase complex dihydrolipoamide dehydrogenase (E3) component
VKKIPMAFSGRFVAENEMGNGVCKLILSEDETLIGAHMLGNPARSLEIKLLYKEAENKVIQQAQMK